MPVRSSAAIGSSSPSPSWPTCPSRSSSGTATSTSCWRCSSCSHCGRARCSGSPRPRSRSRRCWGSSTSWPRADGGTWRSRRSSGCGVLGVSVLLSPDAWRDFLAFALATGDTSGASLVPVPFPVRLALAALLAFAGGRFGDRRGEALLVVALVVGNPTLWMTALSLLVAIVPLWSRPPGRRAPARLPRPEPVLFTAVTPQRRRSPRWHGVRPVRDPRRPSGRRRRVLRVLAVQRDLRRRPGRLLLPRRRLPARARLGRVAAGPQRRHHDRRPHLRALRAVPGHRPGPAGRPDRAGDRRPARARRQRLPCRDGRVPRLVGGRPDRRGGAQGPASRWR